jgi:hypothetical protein
MADDHYVSTWQLQAGEGLVRFLGVPPVNAEFNAPPRPGPRRVGGLAPLVVWLVAAESGRRDIAAAKKRIRWPVAAAR